MKGDRREKCLIQITLSVNIDGRRNDVQLIEMKRVWEDGMHMDL